MPRIQAKWPAAKTLNKKQMAAFGKVSYRAKGLFTKLMEGRFYPVPYGNESSTWMELVNAGLVLRGGRIKIMQAAYVPVGTRPFRCEQFPVWPSFTPACARPPRGTMEESLARIKSGNARMCE